MVEGEKCSTFGAKTFLSGRVDGERRGSFFFIVCVLVASDVVIFVTQSFSCLNEFYSSKPVLLIYEYCITFHFFFLFVEFCIMRAAVPQQKHRSHHWKVASSRLAPAKDLPCLLVAPETSKMGIP